MSDPELIKWLERELDSARKERDEARQDLDRVSAEARWLVAEASWRGAFGDERWSNVNSEQARRILAENEKEPNR